MSTSIQSTTVCRICSIHFRMHYMSTRPQNHQFMPVSAWLEELVVTVFPGCPIKECSIASPIEESLILHPPWNFKAPNTLEALCICLSSIGNKRERATCAPQLDYGPLHQIRVGLWFPWERTKQQQQQGVALLQTLILPIPVDNSWLNPQPPMGTLSLPLEQMNLQFPILLTVYLLDISATYKAQTEDIGWQVDLRLWSLRWSWLQILFIITKKPRSLQSSLDKERALDFVPQGHRYRGLWRHPWCMHDLQKEKEWWDSQAADELRGEERHHTSQIVQPLTISSQVCPQLLQLQLILEALLTDTSNNKLSPPTTHPPFPKSLNLRTTDRHSKWHPWQLLTFSSFWLQKLHQRNPVAETSCAENAWFHQRCHLFLHVKHHHSYEAGYTQLKKNLPPILETKTSL